MKIKENYQCEYCDEIFTDADMCLEHEEKCSNKHIDKVKKKYNFHKCKCCYGCKFYQKQNNNSSFLICYKHNNYHFRISDYDTCDLWEQDPNLGCWDAK